MDCGCHLWAITFCSIVSAPCFFVAGMRWAQKARHEVHGLLLIGVTLIAATLWSTLQLQRELERHAQVAPETITSVN